MLKKKTNIFLLGTAITLLVAILGVVVYLSVTWKGKILPGVRVEWIEVGGLTQKEAEQKISKVQQGFLSAPVEITADGKSITLSRGELGFSMGSDKAIKKAYMVGRFGSINKRINQIWDAYHNQIVIPCQEVTVDPRQAELSLAPFTEGLAKPQNARLVIDDRDQITIIPSKTGIVVDLDTSLKELQLFKKPFTEKIELKFKEEQPQISTADVQAMGINGVISSFTTKFDANNHNRSYNIALAAGALNNTLLKPGEVFSFNQKVGPRTANNGYREAMIIESNEFVPGLGGGVCQVSSTLYNAVLLAGLEIVERCNHSLAVSYIPLGRDATVAYGSQDLKFRNNLDSHIYIKTSVGNGTLTMKIFGNKQKQKNVRLETVIDSVISPKVTIKEDANLLKGKTVVEQAGATGYRVSVYRIINGNKKLLSRDYYRPIEQVVRAGTKAPQPVPKPQPEPQPEEPKEPQEPQEPGGQVDPAAPEDS
ncbi:MAG: VanW family protein [Syntrophaceticus sp.]